MINTNFKLKKKDLKLLKINNIYKKLEINNFENY